MSENRKMRQCPHCKSKKGFSVMVTLGGYETKEMSFKGKILNLERCGSDKVDTYAQCLECGKTLETDFLDLDNV